MLEERIDAIEQENLQQRKEQEKQRKAQEKLMAVGALLCHPCIVLVLLVVGARRHSCSLHVFKQ